MSYLTPDDEALLEQARMGLEPGAEDRVRVKRRLLARIGAVGIGAGASAASTSAAGAATPLAAGGASVLSVAAKIAVTVSLVAGVAGGAAVVHRWTSSKASAEGIAPVQARPAATVASALPLSAVPLPQELGPPAPPAIVRGPSPSAPRAVAEKPVMEAPAAPPLSAVASALAGPSTVGAEADLLRQADAAMKAGDPARALAFVEQHAGSFPRGILVEERDAERVVAMCALGRTDEARALASTFLSAHPRSPLVARVRASCGTP